MVPLIALTALSELLPVDLLTHVWVSIIAAASWFCISFVSKAREAFDCDALALPKGMAALLEVAEKEDIPLDTII